MNEHITKTIQAIDRDVEGLTRLRGELLALAGRFGGQKTEGILPEGWAPPGCTLVPDKEDGATAPHRRKYKKRKTGGVPSAEPVVKRGPYKKRDGTEKTQGTEAVLPRPGVGVPFGKRGSGAGKRTGGFSDKVREVIRGFAGEFTRDQVARELEARWPKDAEVKKKLSTCLVVQLLYMLEHDEVTRTGHGRAAVYQKGKLRPIAGEPTEAQRNYEEIRKTISVPRDPEVESEAEN